MGGEAMSLFGDENYQWRETYFVLFRERDHPTAEAVVKGLSGGDSRFQVSEVRSDSEGLLDSLTLKSPDDFAAMDISYVTGEEVMEQVEELGRDLSRATLAKDERDKLRRLAMCDARFDIFHFEQVSSDHGDGEEEFLDPAALLIVMERLTRLCRGVGIDPQSGAFM